MLEAGRRYLVPKRGRVIGIAVVALAGACTVWTGRPVPTPPAPMRAMRGPVRVTLFDRSSVDLINVVIVTDSLFGSSELATSVRYSYALRDVAKLEVKQRTVARTVLAIAALVALVFVM
jgi:hypothetical protein